MEFLLDLLPWIQIVLAVIITVAILLQARGASVGGAFGGSDGSVHYERRGFERTLFKITIVIAVAFVLSVFVELLIVQKTDPSATLPLPETLDMDTTMSTSSDDHTGTGLPPAIPEFEIDTSALQDALQEAQELPNTSDTPE